MIDPLKMLNRRQALLAGAALATAGLVSQPARADHVDDALKRIVKARSTLKTLQADFKQKRVIGLLAAAVESTGRLLLVRPDRLRWELHPPDAVTYWVGPEGLAVANEDGVTKVGKQAAGRFAAVLGDLMIMLGGDLTKLRKRYTLNVEEREGRLHLSAKPKAKDVAKHVSRLHMEVGDSLWKVERIEIHEANGDKSLIQLGSVVRDKPIKPGLMKPPKA